jgi:NhaP-type Na+/H+ or K+/H+ antiporter
MLVLSPAIGAVVALAAIGMLAYVRRRAGVRRDYESIYSLGVAFAAFAGGEAVHGSGFLAAFAAGLTISALDVELCDCFLEYGETTAEMALLFTFVLFGTSVLWTGYNVLSPATVGFTALVFAARPLTFIPAMLPVKISWSSRALIAWFGPRGLSSLLLVLLAVFANVPGAGILVAVCSLVVMFSILVHGFSPMILNRQPGSKPSETASAVTLRGGESELTIGDPEYITLEKYRAAVSAGEPMTVVDARTERSIEGTDEAPADSVRVDPQHAVISANAARLPQENILVVLCA